MSWRDRLPLARRFLVLIALMFWQGGFTFYASVVVPIGQDVLGSHLAQGFITRHVTKYLNLSGAIALLVLALDLAAARETAWVRRLRWLLWLGMVAALIVLVVLHPRMDRSIDVNTPTIIDYEAFTPMHRLYLWVSTVQWGCALAYAWLTLRAWREADRL
jgi:hypothetical protein